MIASVICMHCVVLRILVLIPFIIAEAGGVYAIYCIAK